MPVRRVRCYPEWTHSSSFRLCTHYELRQVRAHFRKGGRSCHLLSTTFGSNSRLQAPP